MTYCSRRQFAKHDLRVTVLLQNGTLKRITVQWFEEVYPKLHSVSGILDFIEEATGLHKGSGSIMLDIELMHFGVLRVSDSFMEKMF